MKKTIRLIALFLALMISFGVVSSYLSLAANESNVTAEITKYYCTKDGVKLIWNKVPGTDKYYVYRWYSGISDWEEIKVTTKRGYTDKDVTGGTKYYYAVATADGETLKYGRQKSIVFLASPDMKTAKMTSKGIYIKWNKSAGAKSYNIYRKTESTSYKKLGSVKAKTTKYTDTTVKNCKNYTYAVRAVSGDSKSTYSSVTKSGAYIKTPTLVSVKNSPSGVKVSWNKSTAPDSYEILRKTDSGKWKKAGTASASASDFTDKKAPFGKKCTYKVRAVFGENKSYCSNKLALHALDPKKPAIALTWDDGPYSPVTNQILDCLEKYDSRATFFVVGSRVETYKDCVKRQASLDCETGCHTFNHASLTRLSGEEIKTEVNSAVRAIEKYSGGNKVRLVRTPGGAVNDTVRANVGYPMINWSIDTLDWQHRTTSKTVSTIKSQARDGAIVLMHDLYVATGNAAVEIIPWLVNQGYQLVTVSELFDLKGITPQAGQLYTHG